jgi:hypothetical protein
MDDYAFFDGNGNEVTRGWQGYDYQAHAHAQKLANDRGIAIEFQPESELCGLDDGEVPPEGEIVYPECIHKG